MEYGVEGLWTLPSVVMDGPQQDFQEDRIKEAMEAARLMEPVAIKV